MQEHAMSTPCLRPEGVEERLKVGRVELKHYIVQFLYGGKSASKSIQRLPRANACRLKTVTGGRF